MSTSEKEYQLVLEDCRAIFLKKNTDYGTSWRVLRPISIVDQIYIKAQRIRTIQDGGVQKIADSIDGEWRAIVNYGLIALIQLELHDDENWDMETEVALALYNKYASNTFELMKAKNHDYGEAWRQMSQESFADLILTKLLRIKQILSNGGATIVSEGIDSNYQDIINYAMFALIQNKSTLKG